MTWQLLLAIQCKWPLEEESGKLFSLMDLGELNGYWESLLPLTINCACTISLFQPTSIESIAKCLHLEDAHPTTTQLDPHVILSRTLALPVKRKKYGVDKILYLTAIGSIMYAATATCPDIAYAIQTSQSIQLKPGQCTLDHCTLCHMVPICYQE